MTRVMITGVGAIIGYGLIRSLRASSQPSWILGADIYPDAVGQAWCDSFEQAPLTADEAYLEWLARVVEKHRIDLLIPGIEQDVYRLSDDRDVIKRLGCRVALNPKRLLDLARDKWLMDRELVRLEEPSRIPSSIDGDYSRLSEALGLPFIVKPRRSTASKGFARVEDRVSFERAIEVLGSTFIAQSAVGNNEDEYTVGVFGDGEGNVHASITLKRRLARDGSTARAWVRQIDTLDETVLRLCRHFKPLGPANLQFRLHQDEWKFLEINPRISSSSSIRTAFGYNEASMCVDFYLHERSPRQPKIGEGFAVRFIEDHVVHARDHF
ncbi:MAG: ATP-grasp domain-containing protein [Vicinamibacteria bacterium]